MRYRGRGEQSLLPSIPHSDPLTFPTRHSFLDSKLVRELGESESLHGQVVVEDGGTMDQPVVNESVSEEVRVGEFLRV